MPMQALAVPRWTGRPWSPACGQTLIVVAVDTPATPLREAARQQVRAVLREMLGALLACPAAAVPLVTRPGQPPYLAGRPDIGLSISHETSLSLVAIHLAGAVGIDLMQVASGPTDPAEIDRLAGDYLGLPIGGATPALRQHAFAAAWTAHEAQLKCLGLALSEATPALWQGLAGCRSLPLRLADGWVGSVATLTP